MWLLDLIIANWSWHKHLLECVGDFLHTLCLNLQSWGVYDWLGLLTTLSVVLLLLFTIRSNQRLGFHRERRGQFWVILAEQHTYLTWYVTIFSFLWAIDCEVLEEIDVLVLGCRTVSANAITDARLFVTKGFDSRYFIMLLLRALAEDLWSILALNHRCWLEWGDHLLIRLLLFVFIILVHTHVDTSKLFCTILHYFRPRCLCLILVGTTNMSDFATKSVNVDRYIATSCIEHFVVFIITMQVVLVRVAPLGLALLSIDLLSFLLCASFLDEERLAKLRHLPSQVGIQIFWTLACLYLCLLILTSLLSLAFLSFGRYRVHRDWATLCLMTVVALLCRS